MALRIPAKVFCKRVVITELAHIISASLRKNKAYSKTRLCVTIFVFATGTNGSRLSVTSLFFSRLVPDCTYIIKLNVLF